MMRRASFPLSLKILALFLLNIALLITALLFIFRSQFGPGLDSVMAGKSGEKIESVLQLIAREIDGSEKPEWGDALNRFSDAYGVTFTLYHSSGEKVAGADQNLPVSIFSKIQVQKPPKGANRPPPRKAAPLAPAPLFFVKDDGYWLASRIQLSPPEPPGARPDRNTHSPPPDILLTHSTRLSGNNFFPDARPLILGSIGVVLLCGLFWVPFVRGLARSLAQIRNATQDIAGGDFNTKVSEKRNDEIGQLGTSINTMSRRMKGFVNGQQRFLGDIAHELCSPIARMQMALGVLEQRATEDQQPRVKDVSDELQHMAGMVNELLSFSKASLSPQKAESVIVVLAPLLHEVAERELSSMGAEIGLEHSDGLAVMADRQLLSRALGNLLRNAVRYSGNSPAITIDAELVEGSKVRIKVRDFGSGVDEEHLPYLLDPFYRPDKARTRERGGTGLGLAIVKSCVEACGGTVSCRNAEPGFEVTLTLDSPRFG